MNFSKYTTNTGHTTNSANDSAASNGGGSGGSLDPQVLSQMLTSTTPVQIRTPIKVNKPAAAIVNGNNGNNGNSGNNGVEDGEGGGTCNNSNNATAGKRLVWSLYVIGTPLLTCCICDNLSNPTATSPTPVTPPRSAQQQQQQQQGRSVINPLSSESAKLMSMTPDSHNNNRRSLVSTQQQQRRLSEEGIAHNHSGTVSAQESPADAENPPSRPSSERLISAPHHPSFAPLYSPAPNSPNPTSVSSPRRSTSNVFTSYNNQVFIKSPVNTGQLSFQSQGQTPGGLLSRTSSFAGSCSGDDNSVVGISNCMEHMNELAAAQMFRSSVEEEASQRRVAYIAVQFSSISDASV